MGCMDSQSRKICGEWKAIEVTEEGMPIEMDLSAVKFHFYSNGFYNYNSTLNYVEAGTYSIDGDLLYTLDTINKASSEKAVRIMSLTSDSMSIKMLANGIERVFKLAKVN